MATLTEEVRAHARGLGFSLVGVASLDPSDHMAFYRGWIEAGRHGEMAYLAREDAVARRADLSETMADARSVILVAHEYFSEDPEGVPEDAARAVVARYARGEDYHLVVKAKLDELLAWMDQRVDGGVRGRPYVDTGPILERELARRAGLGWFGKNTMLINPDRGSWFFIGLLLVDVALDPDEPFTEDRCGTCSACLEACPTGALLGRDPSGAPVIDARRCISYLTIELRGPIPVDLRPLLGNRVFGCDICQEVCPWNESFARPTRETAYTPRADLDGPTLIDLASRLVSLDDDGFRGAYRGSPLKRTGRAGMLRNVCVALGNHGAAAAVPVLARALFDHSAVVRAHAAWALGEVATSDARTALMKRSGVESEASVRTEIEAALESSSFA